jgi:hypothetical protein
MPYGPEGSGPRQVRRKQRSRPAPKVQPGPIRASERPAIRRQQQRDRRDARRPSAAFSLDLTPPLTRQQREGRNRAAQAEQRAPKRSTPAVPALRSPTPAQAVAIAQAHADWIRRQVRDVPQAQRTAAIRGINRELGNDPRHRRYLQTVQAARKVADTAFARSVATRAGVRGPAAAQVDAGRRILAGVAPRPRAGSKTTRDLNVAGVNVDRLGRLASAEFAGTNLQAATNVAKGVLVDTPRAYVEGKGAPLKRDAEFLVDATLGLVKAPFAIARGQGGEIVQAAKDDYKKRYSPLARGDFETYRKGVREDFGGLAQALDALTVAAPVAKSGGALARSGALGARAERAVTRPRAQLRVSPGDVRRQVDETRKLAPNPVRVATQRARDNARERRYMAQERRSRAQAAASKTAGDQPLGGRRFVQPGGSKERVSKGALVRAKQALVGAGALLEEDRYGRVQTVVVPRSSKDAPRIRESLTSQGFTYRRTGRTDTYFAPREVVARHRLRERFYQRRAPAEMKGRAVSSLREATAENTKVFRDAMRGFSQPERQALVYALQGIVSTDSPAVARGHLRKRADQIVRARTDESGRVAKLARHERDELDTIRFLDSNAEAAFTPRLRRAVERIREQIRDVESANPMLEGDQRLRARYGPQAQFLDVEPAAVTSQRYDAGAALKAIARRNRRDEDAEVERIEAAQRRVGALERLHERTAQRVRELENESLLGTDEGFADFARIEGSLHDISQAIDSARGHVAYLNAMREVRQTRALSREARVIENASTTRPETAAEFARRVRERADQEGLGTPAFVPSQQFIEKRFGTYAVGGTRAPAEAKRRTYALQRKGVQRTDPEVVYHGIQRNLKQAHTVRLVADVFDRHAHPVYRNMTAVELKRAIQREGFGVDEVAIWFPGRFREFVRAVADEAEDMRARGERAADDLNDAETGARHVREAMRLSVVELDHLSDLDRLSEQFSRTRGALVPRTMLNEITATMGGELAIERVLERLKTMQSRAVLGGLNVNWVIADFLANGALASTKGVGPVSIVKANLWMRRLPDEQRRALHEFLDISSLRSNTHVPHLGGSVNSKWVNTWRAWRSAPIAAERNPLRKTVAMLVSGKPIQRGITGFLKAEQVIANDPWRRAVAYKLLRNEAFDRIDNELGTMNRLQARVAAMFQLDPRNRMVALLKERKTIEELARSVDQVLGDYASFTSIERRTVGRFLFFYPYLRFSLRNVFWTLPLNHPIRTSIALKLGYYTEREQRELVGATSGEKWLTAGRVFYRGKDGRFYEQNIRSVNPIGNPLTEAEGSQDVLSMAPPWFQMLLGQIEKRDTFRQQPWDLRGQKTGPYEDPKPGPIPENVYRRLRILARQWIELPPATRELSKSRMPGEQSTESLPFDEIPLRFKSAARQAQAAERRRREQDRTLLEQLMESQLRIAVGKRSEILEQIERRRKRRGDKGPAPITGPATGGALDDPELQEQLGEALGGSTLDDPEVLMQLDEALRSR